MIKNSEGFFDIMGRRRTLIETGAAGGKMPEAISTFAEAILFHPESILTPAGSQLIDNVLHEIKR